MAVTSVCVFCGSNRGARPIYEAAARQMGQLLARREVEVVYGGGNVGLMGVVADAAMDSGGTVIGVIPRALADKELAHHEITKLHVVESMHERKSKMADLSDAFVALPGGYGTFEEFCEIVTWSQLGIHTKPVGLLNVDGYYDAMLRQFDHGVAESFIRPQHRGLVLSSATPDGLFDQLTSYTPSISEKWITNRET